MVELLLDEMYTYSIAQQLRERGHDVVAVSERAALRGAPDREVFAAALQDGRALVTDDIGLRLLDSDIALAARYITASSSPRTSASRAANRGRSGASSMRWTASSQAKRPGTPGVRASPHWLH